MTFQRLLTPLKLYPERPLGVTLLRSCPKAALNVNRKNLCAQFTDNGQIIFPESENQIFSHPHPPPGGFTGRDRLAVVAPFWDDADFSSRQGTIFYQVGLSKSGIQDPPETNKGRQRAVQGGACVTAARARLSVDRDWCLNMRVGGSRLGLLHKLRNTLTQP